MPLAEGVLAGILATGTASGASIGYSTVRDWLQEDAPVGESFEDALAERIDERAEAVDSRALTNVFHHWEVITTEIDTSEVMFDTEEEALDWLVSEIADHEGIDLDDKERQELREVLANEYAEAIEMFYERVSEDKELREQFEMKLGLETLNEVKSIADTFDRLAGLRAYELYDFPDEREAVLNNLLPGDQIPFAERSEVPTDPDPDRRFVLGPSGSGKTRIMAEFVKRFPADAVSQVLLPNQRFLDQSDAKELGRQSFDGDLLLVWDDLHKVEAGEENNVIERTLRELNDALAPDYELYTLLEARSGRLDAISTTLANDFENENSVWANYEPLRVGSVAESSLRNMIDDHVAEAESNIELRDEARDALIKRTLGAESAPQYIKTVITTAEGQVTDEDINSLPENVRDIWQQKPYPKLRDNAPAEWDVLVALKILYDLNVPPSSKLVHAVYLEHLGGDLSLFKTAVEQLMNRQWLTVIGDDLLALETVYYVHDTQLEAIQSRARDRPRPLSDLLLAEGTEAVPKPARNVHYISGVSFYDWEEYLLAKDQWEASLSIDSRNADTHYNYATLLFKQLDAPKQAADHFEIAIDLNPEAADAHNNYGRLLVSKLDAPEQAADHLKTAIDIWFSLGDLSSLRNARECIRALSSVCEECGRSETAAEYCERAFEVLDESTLPQAQQLKFPIKEIYAQLSARAATERLPELYWYGLAALRDREPNPAADMLTEAWSLRAEPDDDASHYLAVAAGVWCFTLPPADIDGEAVIEAVDTVNTARSPVVSLLVDTLLSDEESPDPSQVLQYHSLTDDRHQHEFLAWKSLVQLAHTRTNNS